MVWNGVREKPYRLNPSLYGGQVQCSFTIKLKERQHYFNDRATFAEQERMLLEALSAWQCSAHLYLFMPDHVHLILEGKSDDSDVRRCAIGYKQRAGFAYKQAHGTGLWQKDFFDHIIRGEADLRHQLNYVLMNPVRSGLVDSWREYPYWGSTVYDKEALMNGAKY